VIVLDASATVDWLERRPGIADRIDARLTSATSVHVPHLWFVEVAQVLRRHVLAGQLSADRGRRSLDVAERLAAIRHDHEPLSARIWALRTNLTAYDAAYVALAEVLDAPLLTSDAKLAGAPGHHAVIELP
jgi:predicted nucleic acid-binding protein